MTAALKLVPAKVKARYYYKTVKTAKSPFGKVFLNKKVEDGVTLYWAVNLHQEDAERTWRYEFEAPARAQLERLVSGDEGALARRWEHPDDCQVEAEYILAHQGKRCEGRARLAILAYIEKKQSKSHHALRLSLRDILVQILADQNEIPHQEEKFIDWLNSCFEKICTVNLVKKEILSETTIQQRMTLFKKMLFKLHGLPFVYPQYQLFTESFIRDKARIHLDMVIPKAKKIKNFKPLNKAAMMKVLESCPTLRVKCRIILQLAMGFRFNEVRLARFTSIKDGLFDFNTVKPKSGVFQTPPVPLAAKLILKMGLHILDSEYETWIEEELPCTERELRTTCATHLYLATKDNMLVMCRLNHVDTTMTQRHYVKSRPSDWGDDVSPEGYYKTRSVKMRVKDEEVTVGVENAWDNWLLTQVFNCFAAVAPELLPEAKAILLEFHDSEKYRRAPVVYENSTF